MKKNIILSVVCGMVAMASLTSCNDFLQVSATNQKEMDKSFTTYDLIASLPTNPIHPDLPMRGIHFTLLLRRQTTSLTIMHHRDANISVKHKRMLAREKHVSCGRRLITIWLLTGTMCPLWRIQLLIRKLSIWLPHASRM